MSSEHSYLRKRTKWQTGLRDEHADTAIKLMRGIAGNAHGTTAFLNSIGAAFGLRSTTGNRAWGAANSCIWSELREVLDMLKTDCPDTIGLPASRMAAAMIANQIERKSRNRREPMTSACRKACIDWVTERIDILDEAWSIASPYGRAALDREITPLRKVKIELLESEFRT